MNIDVTIIEKMHIGNIYITDVRNLEKGVEKSIWTIEKKYLMLTRSIFSIHFYF